MKETLMKPPVLGNENGTGAVHSLLPNSLPIIPGILQGFRTAYGLTSMVIVPEAVNDSGRYRMKMEENQTQDSDIQSQYTVLYHGGR